MGDNARLVRYTGEGHGFVLVSTCVTDLEAQVLVWLELPEEGTSCDPDPEIEQPEWWDTLPVPDGVGAPESATAILSMLGLGPTIVYGEAATTALSSDETLDAYDTALADAGYELAGRQQPIDGVDQAFYVTDEAELSIVVIDSDDLQSPDLQGLAGMVEPDQTLVLLLYFPA
jgi:hypothetical protein